MIIGGLDGSDPPDAAGCDLQSAEQDKIMNRGSLDVNDPPGIKMLLVVFNSQ